MISSLPDPQPFEEFQQPPPRSTWSIVDLVVFGVFFALTVVLLPLGAIRIWQIFDPDLTLANLTAPDQVLLQGLINLVIVGFIAFLIKVVHGQSFVSTIHWFKNHEFGTAFLISLGAILAISVLIVSAYIPSGTESPIERLLSNKKAIYVFAIFGIAVAPLFEEIIFRGFLFKVIDDIRGPGTAVSVTAILFALLHVLQLWGNWGAVLLIFVVGYVLSFIRQKSNSLIPSFIIHTSYNGVLFGLFALSSLLQKSAH